MSKAVVALAFAGTAIQAYGAYQQGKQQKALNEYNAKVAEQNAQIAQDKADYDKEQLRRRIRKVKGSQIVALSKAGVDATEGSAIDLFEELAIMGEQDLLMIQYNADLKKRGYAVEAATARFTGAAAYQAGKMRAAGTLLTGGSEGYKYGTETGVFG